MMYRFIKIKGNLIDLDKIAAVSPIKVEKKDYGDEYSFIIHLGTILKISSFDEDEIDFVRERLLHYMQHNAGLGNFTKNEDLFEEKQKSINDEK